MQRSLGCILDMPGVVKLPAAEWSRACGCWWATASITAILGFFTYSK